MNVIQPKPDQALLQTEKPHASSVADDAAKVNLVSPGWMDDKKVWLAYMLSRLALYSSHE